MKEVDALIKVAIDRHEYRIGTTGLVVTEALAIVGEVFRRVTHLDAITYFLSHLQGGWL